VPYQSTRPRLRALAASAAFASLSLAATNAALPVASAHAAAHTAAMPGPSDPLSLTSFKVTGNQQVPTADIVAAFPYHVGDKVSRDQINDGLQKVYALYQQKNVGAKFSNRSRFVNKTIGVELIIEEEAPGAATKQALVLDKLDFVGNAHIKSADLAAASKLVPGQPISSETVDAATKAISALYTARKQRAEIQPVAAYPNKDNHVVLTYQIKEIND